MKSPLCVADGSLNCMFTSAGAFACTQYFNIEHNRKNKKSEYINFTYQTIAAEGRANFKLVKT